MHLLVVPDRYRTVDTRNILDQPQHDRVTPPRCVSVWCSLVGTETNLAEGGLDKVASIGDEKARTANFAHASGDKMAQDKVDINVVISQLRGQGVAPLLKESLAARVGGQIRSGSPAAERTHRQDQTMLELLHDGSHNLCHLEGSQAIDGDNVLELFLWRLEEWNRNAVALSDIVYQDGYIETVDQLGQLLVIGIIILGKVHGMNLDLETTFSNVSLFKLFGESFELRLGSGNEYEIEALGSKL